MRNYLAIMVEEYRDNVIFFLVMGSVLGFGFYRIKRDFAEEV